MVREPVKKDKGTEERFREFEEGDLVMFPQYDLAKHLPWRFILSRFEKPGPDRNRFYGTNPLVLTRSRGILPEVFRMQSHSPFLTIKPERTPSMNPRDELYHGTDEIREVLETSPGFGPHSAALTVRLYDEGIEFSHPDPEEARGSWRK